VKAVNSSWLSKSGNWEVERPSRDFEGFSNALHNRASIWVKKNLSGLNSQVYVREASIHSLQLR